MNTNFLVIRFMAILFIASSFFISCDDDISDVGSNVLIGSEVNITVEDDFTISSRQIDVNQPRTNNLDSYLLGNNDSGFGNTQYGILSQLFSYSILIQDSFIEGVDTDEQDENGDDVVLSTTEVKHELNSIVLVLPFRYDLVDDDDDENDDDSTTSQYYIESILSGETLNLSVYLSNYELQATDPNNTQGNVTESYYPGNGSKDIAGTDGVNPFNFDQIKGRLLVDNFEYTLPTTEEIFDVDLFFDSDDDGDDDEEHTDEGLSNQFTAIRIPIAITDFPELLAIIQNEDDNGDEDEEKQFDISVFQDTDIFESLKGLYIEASTPNGNSIAEILDFDESFVNAGLQLSFTRITTFDSFEDDEDDTEDEENIITTLTFTNNPINILTEVETQELPTIDDTTLEKEIILQSGLGRIATIDLFTEEELAVLLDDNVLLNDAILRLTVNTDSSIYNDTNLYNSEDLPENIFIYEFETGDILTDYISNFDATDDDNESLKEGHLLSLVTTDDNGTAIEYPFYELNITEHLANILNQDSTSEADEVNVTLALCVTGDINITNASDIYSASEEKYINQGSLLSFKTVPLFGPGASNTENNPRLTIKYTSTKIQN